MTGSYQQGLNDELALLQRLAKHHQVQPSSRDENRLQDIDCWVDGVPVSIKTQHAAVKSGNIVFETAFKWRSTGAWEDSWYHTGKADYYLIAVDVHVYKVDSRQLKAWVIVNGFEKEVTTSYQAAEDQANLGHPHEAFKLGIIRLSTLIDTCLAERLDYVKGTKAAAGRRFRKASL